MARDEEILGWRPGRWRGRPARQLPSYEDKAALAAVEAHLKDAAPVVAIGDARALREEMAMVARGRAFVLQGGDCAENFDDAVAERVARLAQLFDGMAEHLRPAAGVPLVRIARIAGQFAKPRSAPTEMRGRIELPAYRGDIINGQAFSAAARAHDPERMVRAHFQSVGTAATLSVARHGRDPIYTSHEALLLPYEEALTRRDGEGGWWATSGHMVWLGDRTRQLDGAHVDYLSGIENVVGLKCGPTLQPDDLVRLCERLDPEDRPGKLVLIGRFGADRIDAALPPLLEAVRGRNLVWIIDPMHGNTEKVDGRKLRRFDAITSEIAAFIRHCRAAGVHPGGMHLEMSPDDVTECLGGGGPQGPADLDRAYRTACDPRLNARQAIELARQVAALL
ncbi:3-deoxy-7-phosphoheptulonate synthase [Sphingomicrobium lutaoense]|uniref:Phospho-2-dehydro-3-deoxyheptonate aldolase n=1 Tax=Sphingomicrobium lutaoense TaxID=515949 RepID=A0A839Z5R9_9SPHN|nr:3-deoxy-7-phosphoheptulonate synthase [Sphingomicrobium lutaoense]MBB3764962.1 3-deoxy-7-phosphoheptulonate synthase [Sphingomicrobium lutaoense]